MKFQPSRKRTVKFIFLILFFGILLGTLLGLLVGFIVPEGVVKDFFVKSITLGWEPVTLNLSLLTLTVGFSFKVSVLSLLGIAITWYYLRYFR